MKFLILTLVYKSWACIYSDRETFITCIKLKKQTYDTEHVLVYSLHFSLVKLCKKKIVELFLYNNILGDIKAYKRTKSIH